MKNSAIVLIGKSGSGKGTQAERLIQLIKEKGGDVHHLEMGHAFRDFLRESNYTATKAQAIAAEGGLQPDFLANYFFTEELVKFANGERNFIIDGTPRTKRQARILDGALRFYGIENPLVIHLDVSDDSVIGRMQERGRGDDEVDSIRRRLDWFREDTMRAIEFFQERNDYYQTVVIDGEKTVEEIADDIAAHIT